MGTATVGCLQQPRAWSRTGQSHLQPLSRRGSHQTDKLVFQLCVNLPVIRPLVSQCSKYVVGYMHSSMTYSGHYTGNSAKGYHNTYGYSRRSNIFSPDSSRFTPATSISHNAPLHSWHKKTGSVPDAIEVLHTVELNSDAVSMSREYGEQNRSDELPLKE